MAIASSARVSNASAADSSPYFLGLDFGTSGARAMVINDQGDVVVNARQGYGAGAEADWGKAWERALFALLDDIPPEVRQGLASIAIDGTSATAMLLDAASGRLLAPPKLYNESQDASSIERAKGMAPPTHTATASTSTLCKLLAWDRAEAWQQAEAAGGRPRLLHQADWLAWLLHGRFDASDWNNALKLGFDPGAEEYPAWLTSQPFAHLLPSVVYAPGQPVAPMKGPLAKQLGIPEGCLVCAGTTDSIAAFLAAGVGQPGEAVTSLGSTLAVKLLSTARIDDAAYGIYSHRLGDTWLVGGASNVGGAVLRLHFSDAQLRELSARIDPARPSGLDYYPLPSPGERFPVNDPALAPRLEPRPADDAAFLQGLLEGVAAVEAAAYGKLAEMGASPLTKVFTAGGGAANEVWTAIRQRKLGVPVLPSPQGEAAYGAALLARKGAGSIAASLP